MGRRRVRIWGRWDVGSDSLLIGGVLGELEELEECVCGMHVWNSCVECVWGGMKVGRRCGIVEAQYS